MPLETSLVAASERAGVSRFNLPSYIYGHSKLTSASNNGGSGETCLVVLSPEPSSPIYSARNCRQLLPGREPLAVGVVAERFIFEL